MNRDLTLIFGDWHVHKFKSFATNDERLQWSIKVIKDLAEFARANGIKRMFFVGDLFHTQQVLLTEVVDKVIYAMMEIFEEYPEITIYAISGNHDHASKNLIHAPAVTGLSFISRISGGRFILLDDKAMEISETTVLHGIPYYGQKEDFDTRLQEAHDRVLEMNDGKYHHLMIHQTPRGLGNAMIPYDTDPEDSRYKVFTKVWCGHIHINLDLAANFTLVGNPNHNDLADAGRKKGFLVTNLNNPDKGYQFIHLQGYPEFMEVEANEEVSDEVEANNYVVRKPDMEMIKTTEKANVAEFHTSLQSNEIMTNFWMEITGGKDEELLRTGLGFLK